MRKQRRVRSSIRCTNFSCLEGDGEEVDSRLNFAAFRSPSSLWGWSKQADNESLLFVSSEVAASSLVKATATPPWLWSFSSLASSETASACSGEREERGRERSSPANTGRVLDF